MQLAVLLAVVITFAAAEYAPSEPAPFGLLRGAIAGFLMLAVVFAAAVPARIAARAVRHNFDERAAALARFERWKRWHVTLWLIVAIGIAWVLAWPQLVRANLHLEGWLLVDDLLLLTPAVLPLVASWGAFYEVELALAREHARRDGEPLPSPRRWRYVLLQARHFLAIIVAPILVLVALGDAARLLAPQWAASEWGWTIYLPPLAVLAFIFPWALATLWPTESLAGGPLRSRLEAASGRVGLRVSDILVWRTQGRMVNAAVAGFLPPLRYIFLTDGLLERLSDDQVEAVFLHEAGHVRRRHLVLRVLLMCLPLWLWLAWQVAIPEFGERVAIMLAALGVEPRVQAAVMWPAFLVVYGVTALGWYSRLLEHDADLWACLAMAEQRSRLALRNEALPLAEGEGHVDVEAFIVALERLSNECGIDPRKRTWLHPSLIERVTFLRRASGDPRFAARFNRRLTWIRWLPLAGFVVSHLLWLV